MSKREALAALTLRWPVYEAEHGLYVARLASSGRCQIPRGEGLDRRLAQTAAR